MRVGRPGTKERGEERKKAGHTGTDHALRRLERHRPELVHARARTRDDHRVLAAHLVAREWVVRREGRRVLDHVEVGQRGFDHDDVGAFGDVAGLDVEGNGE